MAILGPTRLLLIHSGRFDFADVDLTRPLHLVGPNNVGKTTLVNLLQFLYVDSLTHMSFAGYDLRETRRYYFPERHSYVLFECRTPEGLKVFGVHGTGPAERYHVQRFAYDGPWMQSDFLTEDDAPRPVDEVKPELALKNLRLLEARHLRAALTGVGDNKGVHLALVPVQSRHGYERFRDLFKGLIRLRHLDQETLKSTLCNTYAAELGALSVNLKTDYADQFSQMQTQRSAIERLERIEEDIQDALSFYEKRQRIRIRAVQLWNRLTRTTRQVRTALETERADVEQTLREQEQARSRLHDEKRTLNHRRDALNQQLGRIQNELDRLRTAVEAAADVDSDATAQELRRMQREQAALRAKVQSIAADDPERIRTRLRRASERVRAAQERLENLEDAVGPVLRKALGEARMNRLFRVLNPEMLDLNPSGPHLHLTDRAALLQRLQRLDDDLTADPWTGPWGTVSLRGLSAPSLDAYIDPERIRADLREYKDEETRLTERLRIAQNRSQLEAEAQALQEPVEALQAELHRHREARAAAERLPECRAQKSEAETKRQAVTRELDDVERSIGAHDEQIREADARRKQIQDARRALQAEHHDLQAPPSAWGASDDVPVPEDDADAAPENEDGPLPKDPLSTLRPLLTAYRNAAAEEERTDKRLHSVLSRIHRQTAAQYERDTLEDTLQALRDERDGLVQRRNAVERMWQQLRVGLGRKLNDLLESLDALKGKVSTINRRLSGTSVSDLKRLKLVLSPIDETVRLLKRTAEQDAMPLFGDPDARADDERRLDTMLRTHPRIRLTDLFNVAFEVETVDGTVKRYDSLQSIESNGTNISIKVLIHLVLINDLLSDAERTLPFYLDEASSLDDRNLDGIVRAAQTMGFVPILASPTESTAVDHLYYLRSTGDRVYLGPEQRVRLESSVPRGEASGASVA